VARFESEGFHTTPGAGGCVARRRGKGIRALEAVRLSVKLHVPSMVWVQATPELAALYSDPRFTAAVLLMQAG